MLLIVLLLRSLLHSLVDTLLVFSALYLAEVWFKAGVGLNPVGVAWHLITSLGILPHFLALTFLFTFIWRLSKI